MGICWALFIFCVFPFAKTLHNLKVISPFPPLTSIVHSINCRYILFRSKVWRNLKNSPQGASGWFILTWGSIIFLFPDARQLGEENNIKNGKLSILWVVVEKLQNHIEIVELLYFFFIRKIYLLLTSNIFAIKTKYFLNKFWCPFSNVIIGFKKLLNFVSNSKAKKKLKISIFSSKSWFL